jgi:hypothetical protein
LTSKTLLEEQIKHSKSTSSWSECITNTMKGFAKKKGASKRVNQGIIKVIKKYEHEILNT